MGLGFGMEKYALVFTGSYNTIFTDKSFELSTEGYLEAKKLGRNWGARLKTCADQMLRLPVRVRLPQEQVLKT